MTSEIEQLREDVRILKEEMEALKQGPDAIRIALHTLPEAIAECDIEVHQLDKKIDDVLWRVKIREHEMMKKIYSETTGDGKHKYPNEKLRDAELDLRKKGDRERASLWDQYQRLKIDREGIKIRHDLLRNRFKGAQYTASLMTKGA
ncbi:MAG: hypothetical protein DRJ03_27370 [Chloroflexi bacterium]|nr:MAG: hypothetical protein DRJ03_27370 [Chloroflexota bacterium]